MTWYEVRLRRDCKPRDFYDWLAEQDTERKGDPHHFWDEPWWPGGYVIRVPDVPNLVDCPAVDHVVVWDASSDEELYGAWWEWAQAFFSASSALSTSSESFARREKFVHCFLNAHGMSVWAEARFAVRFWWRRVSLAPRWHLYLRRRYEREQRRRATA